MKRNTVRTASALLIALTLLIGGVGESYAFNQVNARQLAMGGAAISSFRGVNTIGWNPSYLAFRDNPNVSVQLPALTPNVGLRLSNDFLSMDEVNTYFTDGQVWTDEDKQNILNAFNGNSWDFYTDFYLPVFGVTMQTKFAMLGFNYDVGLSADWSFSKEFMDLALNGSGIDQLGVTRDFSDTDFRAHAVSRFGFTFARGFNDVFEDVEWIDEFTFGFTVSYLMGHAYGEVVESEMSMLTDVGTFNSEGYVRVLSAGGFGISDSSDYGYFDGTGAGLDVGFGAKIFDGKGSVGISIINLLNTIRYETSQQRIYSFSTDSPLPLNQSLTNPNQFIEENFTMVDSLTEAYGAIEVHLPTTLHLNGSWNFNDALMLSSNIRFGLNEAAGGSKTVRAGAGVAYSGIPLLPLYAGASLGGRGGFSYGVGFGLNLGFWHTDIGWAWERGILNSANGLYMSMSSVWFFGSNSALDVPKTRKRTRR